MARKKSRNISKRQSRKMRFYQLLMAAIALIMIATMVITLIR